MSYPSIAAFLLIAGTAAYAYERGGRPERWATTVLCAATLAGMAQFASSAAGLRLPLLVWIDALTFLALLWLATATGRRWLKLAAACQLLAVGSHFVGLLDPVVRERAHIWMMLVWSNGAVLALLLGVATTHRRRLRHARLRAARRQAG